MNLESDKRLNIQLRLDFSSAPKGEARQAGGEDIESLLAANEPERPADTRRIIWSKRVSVTSRTAVYGPVRTVVWEGRSREAPPYPDVCWACSVAWRWKSSTQPDGGEGLATTQGLSPRGEVWRKRIANVRVDGQTSGTRRKRRTSGPLTAKSISIKDAKRRPGDCARKATELTPGDLLCVASATEGAVRRSDRRAEVSRGHSGPCRRQG